MSITPSAASEIRTLIASLSADDEVKRESAVARLAIIGARAVDRLVAAYAGADHATRLVILRAAEAIADPRAIPIAREALASGGDLAVMATSSLRALLDSPRTSAATESLDILVATVLDRSADRRVRLAAFDALQDMPAAVRTRVAEALRSDDDPGMRARATASPGDSAHETTWQEATAGRLGDDPDALRDALRTRAGTAPLGTLQLMIDAIHAREAAAPPARREAWRAARGALHQALALRGSRIAVYDLRETVAEAQGPLPASFLAALQVVGDPSCLEPIAAAWTAASGEGMARWRHQLATAVQSIARREKVSQRSVAWKRLASRFPAAAADFSTTSRTTPRPTTRRRT